MLVPICCPNESSNLSQLCCEQGMVFHCWENIAETVIHSELGASLAIKKAGFNLGSLMLRYQVWPSGHLGIFVLHASQA